MPYDVPSYKRPRDASDSARQSSSESPESLQKLRRLHRFTLSASESPQGDHQLRNTAYDKDPSREDHHQLAIIDHDGQFKESPSGQKKADEFLEQVTQGKLGSDKQIYIEKLKGYTKTRNKVTLQQRARYLQLYNESDDGESDAESEDNRSTRSSSKEGSPQRDAEPERDEGTSSRYNEGYRSSETSPEIPIGPNPFFYKRYAYNTPRVQPYDSYRPGSCGINVTMTLFHFYGVYPNQYNVADSLDYPVTHTPVPGGIDHLKIREVLKKFSNGTIRYQDKHGTMDLDEMREVLKKGPFAAQFFAEKAAIHVGKDKYVFAHIVVVDGIETNTNGTFVCILDAQGNDRDSYKVPIDEWESVCPFYYCVPK